MSGKKARLARAVAYKEAVRQKLLQRGEGYWYRKLWRRFMAWVFPQKRLQYADHIGAWYKHTLKDWSKAVYSAMNDPDIKAFERARRKINRRYAAERQAVKAGRS